MILRYFYDHRLAQASYLVGCAESGTAIVIDPARDITPYIQTAQEQNLRIEFVAETHIHADFISGSRQLSAITGAQIILSGEGGKEWQYAYPTHDNTRIVHDRDTVVVGNVVLEVMHTPGHTPEHISFLLTDTKTTNKPIGVFTGDFLFAGDIGRPDLLERVVHLENTAKVGAHQQFHKVQRFKTLPDYLQVWPAHGAGSACGKALGAIPSSTLGYEKLVNPAFQITNEEDFVTWLLSGQPEAPIYFAQMKKVNKVGASLLQELGQPQHIADVPDVDIVPSDALFLDTRPAEQFAKQHIQGTINIPINNGQFNTYVGWYVNYDRPTFFIAYPNEVQSVINALLAIGVDDLRGYFTPEVIEQAPNKGKIVSMSSKDIYQANLPILDVRGVDEFASEHIPTAYHIHMGEILARLDELPRDKPFAVQCGSGVRSQIVVSLLQRAHFEQVINLDGGIDAWKRAKLPVETA